MDYKTYRIFLFLAYFGNYVHGQECFSMTLDGDGYVIFDEVFNYTTSVSLSIDFSTTQENGLIYYKEGKYDEKEPGPYDYEALFIRNSTLNYFVFNPSPVGTGATFGCHLKTDFNVSNGTWFSVQFFRNKRMEVSDGDQTESEYETGMIVNGIPFLVQQYQSYIGNLDLERYTYIGGFRDMERLNIDKFEGKLQNFSKPSTNERFRRDGLVVVGMDKQEVLGACLRFPPPS